MDSAASGDLADWLRITRGAAREAYELACPHETPRQLKAYAFGLSVLFKQDVEKPEEPEAEEREQT